ncbi:MAG: response regulator transcription factor [Lachnospiraceae bacterium]|nr:response regulator transcription factor [Lachnospiraceae bacterium]
MYRLLIVEDDNDINNLICNAFSKEGYVCVQAFSGTEGLLYIRNENFDLVILDLMLPGMSGEELVKEIKALRDLPVIVVSAKDSIDSKIELLTSGADDYLTKPFEVRELLARAALQLRKAAAKNGNEDKLSVGNLTLDKTSYTAAVCGKQIPLTRQEFKILELLMLHPDKIYTKQEIYNYAWSEQYIGEDKTVNVHISNIRKKLRVESGHDYIETVWGIGFRLKAVPKR